MEEIRESLSYSPEYHWAPLAMVKYVQVFNSTVKEVVPTTQAELSSLQFTLVYNYHLQYWVAEEYNVRRLIEFMFRIDAEE